MNIFNWKPTVLADETNTGLVILIVVISLVAVILLITGYLLLDKYFFSRKRCRSQLKTLERKYEYLHALLSGQDFQYVQRIEIISRTNLLYSDIYTVYLKRYNDLRDNQETKVTEVLNELVHLLDKANNKEFKKVYKKALTIIGNYEELVNSFNNDLVGVIKPEEDARQNSLGLKDTFRDVKSKYNVHEDELSFVSETFSKVFSTIDERFTKFEALIETADYEEANNLLPEISDVLKVCDKLIDSVPPLIKRTNEIIPDELTAITEHYEKLLNASYPLKHVGFENMKNDVENGLQEARTSLQDLKITNLDLKLNNLDDEIRHVEEMLVKEEDAAKEFNDNVDRVYNSFNDLEKEFIKVRNNIAKYSKYYIVDDVHQAELKDIQKNLDDVSKDKRRLDMYVHSLEKTPYTILVVKMRDLDDGTTDLFDRFNRFKNYLASLKTDTEEAFSTINLLYFKLKECEATLRSFNNEEFSDKFNDDIDKSYKIIDDVIILLKSVPINVNLVNTNMQDLTDKTNIIFGRVNDAKKYYDLSKDEIMFLNRERVKFSDINIQLSQAESLFLNGDYSQCYLMVEDVKKKIEAKDNLHD
jgi:septation ring formation regulator